MVINEDNNTYDELHQRLLRNLLMAIKDELEGADLDHDEIYEMTAKLAFAVASVIDGVDEKSDADGAAIHPFLAFATGPEGGRSLIVNDHGSYLHELVHNLFDAVLDERDDDEDEDEDDDEFDEEYEYEEEEDEEFDEEEYDEEDDEEDGDDADPESGRKK